MYSNLYSFSTTQIPFIASPCTSPCRLDRRHTHETAALAERQKKLSPTNQDAFGETLKPREVWHVCYKRILTEQEYSFTLKRTIGICVILSSPFVQQFQRSSTIATSSHGVYGSCYEERLQLVQKQATSKKSK